MYKHITFTGYHSKREYIAAQGPLQCTKDDFWRMTWEQNVSVIVMLTQCVERGRGQKKRKIKQIHFLKWPDFGCPETTWLLLDFVMAVRLYKPHDMQGPIIVHCSAGVGRTGTFIALDHLLYRIKEHDEIDIFNIVLEMRNYRPSMVQTEVS
ncbi:hypothetical protein KUTeg_007266 [Tegillarca granosa]|uniref:Uncharacterized protein n=1 Tax=Tegillarca granosa TaxID=220873 RepID=A0ABQ9FFZ8_TEGGR|nr:hypothetical protein KUTeg_007266 [Tegillarca granosa]